jgi:hypothetical protein
MNVKLSYRLEPAAREAVFRQAGLKRDIRVTLALILLAVLFHLLSFPTDFGLLGDSATLSVVWGLRGAGVAIDLLALFLIWRCNSAKAFDRIIFIWVALLLAGVIAANALLPADYTIHVAWDLLLALAVYAVTPLYLSRQVALALLMTLGNLVLFAWFKVFDRPVAFYDVLSAFVCANIIGVFTSWELHRWRRQQFSALQNEVDARSKLEVALLEVKTLKGIIPICANCKNIRTDEGVWKQIEAYVREHSDADFTHGICPDCVRKHYPEVAERVMAMGKKKTDQAI